MQLFCAGEPELCQECSERLWKAFLAPAVFYPLAAGDMLATGPGPGADADVRRMSINNWTRTWLPPSEPFSHFNEQHPGHDNSRGHACSL